MSENPLGQVVLCKTPSGNNPVAKKGRICDSCYLLFPGGRKSCPRCQCMIHIKQKECAKHMLDARGGLTRRKRESIPIKVRKQVYERDSYTCVLCGLVGEGQSYSQMWLGVREPHLTLRS